MCAPDQQQIERQVDQWIELQVEHQLNYYNLDHRNEPPGSLDWSIPGLLD